MDFLPSSDTYGKKSLNVNNHSLTDQDKSEPFIRPGRADSFINRSLAPISHTCRDKATVDLKNPNVRLKETVTEQE
ncbi:hypothetical protein QJS10_CPA05g00697 [Acorus calamus]|uniref:Uncharacterized protein n=1 Tax=Acorus calamus TaxID=4465 RepID=A0AAV9ESS7_ACOCL|nr:hypothetical protein QJS10_CPA05g00697 [Acorus calamus]